VLWTVGASLLHSGVVINGKEYAYGGHDHPNLTGVYWTKPKTEPPGGTFKCEILHGFTLATDAEIEAAIRSASDEFQGRSYNLLTKNCNHFTSHLCKKLTGTPGPGWLNRAASIGVAMPCMVPREWVEPPEYDTADGALLDDYENSDEQARMLQSSSETPRLVGDNSTEAEEGSDDGEDDRTRSSVKGKHKARDTSGRTLPPAERAPSE
jgi:hypothetical protein